MKKKSRILALQLAQLLEEYTATEISEAVKLLEASGSTSGLLTYLNKGNASKQPISLTSRRRQAVAPKQTEQATSKAVRELLKSDPDRYQVLFEFDQVLRRGDALKRSADLRRFGEVISKEFHPRSNRRDNISALMSVLTLLPIEEMKKRINEALSTSDDRSSSNYEKLATFLMSGTKDNSP
ncbi:hypothetical protein [Pseudovibrio sp. FO-BEG1]|uniref:hypothetical protein n=1 Tax=Pseudovibrio sp. (strain FO-BEG1) TaxID=911045 RepID=UPI0005A2A7DE|nr:hypothetical protein [Pseudovibrio sp. FO-BEG1]